ncbi:Hint domain-containing protein [Paracoccus shandongensis]|uniref:Hint domain-containing protein n=1 Tax=Paracoccus shandongensis TaxID=2816048 RepID=UPI001A9073E8|nr:Hint domain-containing protein [Paracoccus shandongensis]
MRKVSYVSLQDLSFSGGSWAITSDSGAGLVGNQVTVSSDYELSSIIVSDDDGVFEDDDNGDGWGDNGIAQTLGEAAVLNGVTYPAGTALEAEYELTLGYTDGEGVEQSVRILAVKAGNTVVGYAFADGVPPSGVALNILSNRDSGFQTDGSFVAMGVPYEELVPCFTRGVLIETDRGPVAVEDLSVGDLVLTRDDGPQPIRWIGSKRLSAAMLRANEALRPIRIRAGALGADTPSRDLLVSPQHRILLRSRIAQRMFGTDEVLVAAKQLLLVDGIDIADERAGVEYFHILFDKHQVVISNGAESESLHTGPQALKSVGPAAREEIFTIFPELRDGDPAGLSQGARMLLSGRQGRRLAHRHAQNARPLVM